MHRTQILLEEGQYEMMKTLAEREGRSLSSLIRDAVRDYLRRRPRPATARLAEITGIGEDTEARGRAHDDLLYRPRREPT